MIKARHDMPEHKELPEISEHTTVNELADIVRKSDHSITLRICDNANQAFGAIRLVSADELDQIDHIHKIATEKVPLH